MIFQLIFSLIFFIQFNSNCSNQPESNNVENQKTNNFETSHKTKNNNIFVRVLLDEMPHNSSSSWKISNDKKIILRSKTERKHLNSIEIRSFRNKFYLNNQKFTEKILRIDSIEGHLKFNDKEFAGAFFIINENNSLLLINRVELEDYLYSVLFTESWPGWPLEVNKAFAIASRSYVIAKYLENKEKTKKHYHVKNTNKHQTYYGTHKSINLRTAVDETKGIILGYNKKPILAMFDACCGGIIPANIKGVNFKDAPYLQRKEACLFCKSSKSFSWQVQYSDEQFIDILKKELPKLKNIQTINIIKDKANVVQQIKIKDKKNNIHNLTGKKFYSLFDKVKSFSFSINKVNKKVLINGNGYGHHLGICQWGAREMVNQGWDYESILQFYYPGTSFMKLHKNSK